MVEIGQGSGEGVKSLYGAHVHGKDEIQIIVNQSLDKLERLLNG